MTEALIPMVVCTSMFAMIFGIVYLKSRENMALIEKGINPKQQGYRPRPFVNLKWGLLLIGCGLGLLCAIIIDAILPTKPHISKHKSIEIHNKESKKGDTAKSVGKHTIIIKEKIAKTQEDSLGKYENFDTDTDTVAFNIDENSKNITCSGKGSDDSDAPALYFALIAIGGGLGLFFSYKIEKKEWLDKNKPE